MHSSDRMKTLIRTCLKIMTRTSCLGTAKCIIFNIYFPSFLLNALPKSWHDQPLLDYFWDISIDWERMNNTTTLRGRLMNSTYSFQIKLSNYSYPACKSRSGSSKAGIITVCMDVGIAAWHAPVYVIQVSIFCNCIWMLSALTHLYINVIK